MSKTRLAIDEIGLSSHRRADDADLRLGCEVCAKDCVLATVQSSVRCRACGVAVNPPDHIQDPTVQVGLHLKQARLGPAH